MRTIVTVMVVFLTVNVGGLGCNAMEENAPEENVVLNRLLAADSYTDLLKLEKHWQGMPEAQKKQLVSQLGKHLDSQKEVALPRPEDMVVKSRMLAGKMQWHGHGTMLDHDIFTESGRCAWAIESIMGTPLPALEYQLEPDEFASRTQEIRRLVAKFTGD